MLDTNNLQTIGILLNWYSSLIHCYYDHQNLHCLWSTKCMSRVFSIMYNLPICKEYEVIFVLSSMVWYSAPVGSVGHNLYCSVLAPCVWLYKVIASTIANMWHCIACPPPYHPFTGACIICFLLLLSSFFLVIRSSWQLIKPPWRVGASSNWHHICSRASFFSLLFSLFFFLLSSFFLLPLPVHSSLVQCRDTDLYNNIINNSNKYMYNDWL